MVSSDRIYFISTILILLIVQINGGYWICDWVSGRGWMYCSRGYCNSFGKKRSLTIENKQTGPDQNDDGTYCLGNKFCYECQPINDNLCLFTLQQYSSPISNSILNKRRVDENACT